MRLRLQRCVMGSYWSWLWDHGCVLGCVEASRLPTGPHSPYEDGRCARPSPLRRLRPVIGFQTLVVKLISVFEPPH